MEALVGRASVLAEIVYQLQLFSGGGRLLSPGPGSVFGLLLIAVFVYDVDNQSPSHFQAGEVDAGRYAATNFASTPRYDEKEPLCFILKTSVHLWVSAGDRRKAMSRGLCKA